MNFSSELRQFFAQQQTRRAFLGRASQGVGRLALASMVSPALLRAVSAATAQQGNSKWTGVVHPLDYPPKAKRVIWLSMAGGPSHLETFDFKPQLAKLHGQPMPESMTRGQQLAQLQGQKLTCFGPQTKFRRYGGCGAEMTELFPHMGAVADELCIV